MPWLQRIVSIPSSGGNSCSTFSFSDFGYHLGHPLSTTLLPVFSRLLSKKLSFFSVIDVVPPLDTDDFVFSTMSYPCGKFYLDRSSTSTWSRVPCWWC